MLRVCLKLPALTNRPNSLLISIAIQQSAKKEFLKNKFKTPVVSH